LITIIWYFRYRVAIFEPEDRSTASEAVWIGWIGNL
jgi:hypothetical protein